jgi:arabinose-5-phosphate isomerase
MKKINFKKIAKKVIDEEASAIKKLKKTVNASFDKAVNKILNIKNGKVIFSGTGKSGAVGAIISSTFSSVGISSFFVDANDAGHGSLGAIEKNDIVILISYSGETAETFSIINFCKRRKITLIGIVSKINSTVAKGCDINLIIPSIQEADPNSIVPTSSLLMSISIGHCLAIATMNYRKFGKFDFKKFHPSGSLGEKLKTVEELMVKDKKVPFIRENILMSNALIIMNKFNQGVLIVRNKNKQTLGIISDGDIKRISNKNNDIKKLIAKNIMKKNPITVDKNMIAAEALSIMNSKKVTCLCVHSKKNKRKTLGIITVHNILNANIQ